MSIVFDLHNIESKTPYKYKDTGVLNVTSNSNTFDVTTLKDLHAIHNSVSNILHFNPGERVLIPEFGNVLRKYLYEEINQLLHKKIKKELMLLFKRWEPRIEVVDIFITSDPDRHEVNISLTYDIPSLDGIPLQQFTTVINKGIY